MAKAVLCPVCNGVGKVSAGFYNRGGDCQFWVSGTTNPEVCRSCNGKGWVEVSDSDYNPWWKEAILYPSTVLPDRCLDCGGDRRLPAGTGCRQSNHYGTLSEQGVK